MGAFACADDGPDAPDAQPAGSPDAAPDGRASAPDAGGGTATITGAVDGYTVAPIDAFFMVHPVVNAEIIVMPEAGMACSTEGQSGVTTVIGFPCGPATVGVHAVRDSQVTECDVTDHVFVLVEGHSGELAEYLAGDGSVTLTALTAERVTGSFTADFGDLGALDGAFDAVVCD